MAFLDVDDAHIPCDPHLLSFLAQLRKGGGLSIVASIIPSDLIASNSHQLAVDCKEMLHAIMKHHGVHGFCQAIVSSNVLEAKQSAMQAVGLPVRVW